MATTATKTRKSRTAPVARKGTFFKGAKGPAFFAPAKRPAPLIAGPEKAVVRTSAAALRLQPPVRPKPVRPADDPAFTRVTGAVKVTAKQKRAHAPAAAKAAEAQGAAVPPTGDIDAQAKAAKADTMQAQRPGAFDKKAFIAAVKAAIEAKSPKNLEEAADVRSGRTGEVKAEVQGLVTQGKNDQAADIRSATDAPPDRSKAVPKVVTPMGPEPAGPVPRIAATGAVPKPAPPEQLNLAAGKHQTDQEMAEADVTDTQLAESNEPQFQTALSDKKTAAAHADTAPGEFRAHEAQVLAQGKAEAGQATGVGVAGMQSSRVGAFAKLVARKTTTKSADEVRRAQVTAEIERIFTATESAVKAILDAIDGKVEKEFSAGESFARESFETFVAAKMSAYKRDRYGGVFGGARWAKDKLFGMPDAVNQFYVDGRALYLREMDRTITRVANIVGDDLTAAKTRITQGRNEIDTYVKGLPKDLKKVGADAAKEIGSRFAELESSVDAKASALVDTLATKYVAARKSLDERIEALQAANKGLVDKAIGAIKAVIKTIREFISTMTSALARAASVVGQIIKAPIKFLGNLIAGVKGGIAKFRDDFLGHLRRGLMSWLFGEVADSGIELPKSFDLKGIIGFLAALLGLTWANIRSRLVKRVGERTMGAIEKGVGIFSTIAKEGLGGVWNLLVEKLGDVKEMIFDQVKDFVRDKIIVAGVTWLIGLLNPAAAFIKACKLIIDIVMFFVRNAARIARFVNTILDSVADMVRGNVAAVVNKINDALGQMVPIIIGFLASLIGVGGIGKKVREIVQKLQKPVNVALDFVIDKGLALAGPIIRGISGVAGKVQEKVAAGKEWVKGKAEAGLDAIKRAVLGRLGRRRGVAMLGKTHHVYVAVRGTKPTVMIASEPEALLKRIARAEGNANVQASKLLRGKLRRAREECESVQVRLELAMATNAKEVIAEAEINAAERMDRLEDQLIQIGRDYDIAELSGGIYVLDGRVHPDITQKKIRPTFYGPSSRYQQHEGTKLNAARSEMANQGIDPLKHPAEFWCPGVPAKNRYPHLWRMADGYAVDHVVPVAAHWLGGDPNHPSPAGNDSAQTDRETWYPAPTNLQILCAPCNSAKQSLGATFKREVTDKFTGPKGLR